MAEKSYPFSADSAGGGGKLVSQTQWQAMAHGWGSDRVDFPLTNTTYSATDLPLAVSLSGSNLVISSGSAWVGGFYYKLDAPLTIAAPTNNTATPRIDTVVLRASLSTGSVNVALVTGQAATTPVETAPKRILGDIWEFPLAIVTLPANNGTRVVTDRRAFAAPGRTTVPWNRSDVSAQLPIGSFTLDMDSNNNGVQSEGFYGRDGDMIARTMGKRAEFTPDLFTVSGKPPAGNRKGFWRYIAPGTVQFSIHIYNTTTTPVRVTAGWFMAFTLPVPPSRNVPSTFTGVLSNPESRNDMPNLVSITAQTQMDSGNTCALFYPNSLSLAEGLDGLATIPGMSNLSLSGVYETNFFEERTAGNV